MSLFTTLILTSCSVLSTFSMSLAGAGRGDVYCKGVVKLISPCGLSIEYYKTERHINFNVLNATLEGCSCFRLFERKHFHGKSFLVGKPGMQKIPLKRVRSLKIANCE